MPEVTISYIQKNGSTYLGKEVVQSDYIPKVGELIYNRTKFERSGGEGFVICVAHEVVNGKTNHYIVAREGHQIPGAEELNNYSSFSDIEFES